MFASEVKKMLLASTPTTPRALKSIATQDEAAKTARR
jgi:hypothetical protein